MNKKRFGNHVCDCDNGCLVYCMRRMVEALEGETIKMPHGLTFEEMRDFILNSAKDPGIAKDDEVKNSGGDDEA